MVADCSVFISLGFPASPQNRPLLPCELGLARRLYRTINVLICCLCAVLVSPSVGLCMCVWSCKGPDSVHVCCRVHPHGHPHPRFHAEMLEAAIVKADTCRLGLVRYALQDLGAKVLIEEIA